MCGIAFIWIDDLGEIPIDQHATSDVGFIVINNHNIPGADVSMKNTSIKSSLVSYKVSQFTLPDCEHWPTHQLKKHESHSPPPSCG